MPASNVHILFRIDIGFDPQRGYAAAVMDIPNQRQKGIKGNSPEQLMSRLRNVFLEEMRKQRNFPLESEASQHPTIIMPEDGDPLFNGT